MVLLYNDKTAVDAPDCKMMKIWLSQNFLIGTAPRSLDKRHGQVRKCRRNLTSYCSASDWAPYNTKCCEKVKAVHVGRPPALKLKNWKTEKQKNSQIPWKRLTLHSKAYRRWYLSATTHCEYLTKRSLSVHITEIVRATKLCAQQDGNEYLRIKWARLFSPLKRNRRVPAEMIVLSETST